MSGYTMSASQANAHYTYVLHILKEWDGPKSINSFSTPTPGLNYS